MRPILAYFLLTFAISRIGAAKMTAILTFPAMLVGPCFAGVVLTTIVDGPKGLRNLFARMNPVRAPLRWYGTLILPPMLIGITLLSLETFVSPVFAPNC